MGEDGYDNNLRINQQTGNDFCIQITGDENAIAKDWWSYGQNENRPIEKGQLVCEIPSYDSTHNIVVKKNNE